MPRSCDRKQNSQASSRYQRERSPATFPLFRHPKTTTNRRRRSQARAPRQLPASHTQPRSQKQRTGRQPRRGDEDLEKSTRRLEQLHLTRSQPKKLDATPLTPGIPMPGLYTRVSGTTLAEIQINWRWLFSSVSYKNIQYLADYIQASLMLRINRRTVG